MPVWGNISGTASPIWIIDLFMGYIQSNYYQQVVHNIRSLQASINQQEKKKKTVTLKAN